MEKDLISVEKIIREEKTAFDKTALAQDLLSILSGYKNIEAAQELVKTILSFTLESLKANKLPEAVLLSLPAFYQSMLMIYTATMEQKGSSLIEELFNLKKEEDPRLMAMEDTKFIAEMVQEIQGHGVSEERRKYLVDRMLLQIGTLLTHKGIAAEHKQHLNEFAELLLPTGENVQGT